MIDKRREGSYNLAEHGSANYVQTPKPEKENRK